ncbi:ABC transporter, permease protein 1 (cluster 11, riboflavin/purine nucleoside/unknown) [Olavius algarvensis Delta 1 endosymbiont]|nr:ABC transporter, permease protein 1 (cluster 11, riboflavin/purine nucleoside/unknown) [Olavius algarvensis Delta 1 endosymbiont]
MKISRLFRYQTILGILSPLVAVLLAFVVGGLVILVFIKSFVFTPAAFEKLQAAGIPTHVLEGLEPLENKEFPNHSAFEKGINSAIGEQNYQQYGGLIADQTRIRENPLQVYNAIFTAALSNRDGWGNVLYRATPLIFTGLAVALAFQCGLFNIGGEGQMVMGGFAITWIGFTFVQLPSFMLIPLCIMGGAAVGAMWASIPGYLKARRGVHEVVTTIMLNWIAVAFTQYLTMAYKPKESWIPHTHKIAESAQLARIAEYLNTVGIDFPKSNLLNTSVLLAIGSVIFVAFLLKRTKLGYEIRSVGFNPSAAECAGISVAKNTVLAMAISGAIAGLAGVNQVMGYKHRFRYGVFEGLGFDGIGVAFIGRNSPLGVVLAALLFGILDHGGLAIDVSTRVPREIVLVLKAAILIFVVVSGEITKRLIKLIQKRQEAKP